METRTSESIVFEAEYWMQVNQELVGLLDNISEAAALLAAVAVIHAEMSILVAPGPGLTPLEKSAAGLTAAMEKLGTIQDRVIAVGELVGGRIVALREESQR